MSITFQTLPVKQSSNVTDSTISITGSQNDFLQSFVICLPSI